MTEDERRKKLEYELQRVLRDQSGGPAMTEETRRKKSEYQRLYLKTHPEVAARQRERQREYRERNKEKIRETEKERKQFYREHPELRLAKRIQYAANFLKKQGYRVISPDGQEG